MVKGRHHDVSGPGANTSPFANSEYRALWLAYVQSIIGDQFARVALSVLVFERTRSAGWTAATYALTYLPALFSGVFLSGLADRYPRRTVMVAADVVRALLVVLMALPAMPIAALAVLMVLVQLAEAPFTAAQRTVLPAIVGERAYERSQRIMLVTYQIGQLAGFAAAGLLVQLIGTRPAIALNAATFAASSLLIAFGVRHRPIPTSPPTEERGGGTATRSRVGARIGEGARLIWSDRRLRLLAAFGWLAGFSVVPEGLAPAFAAEIDVGPVAVGLLLAARPAGTIIAATLLGRESVGLERRLLWLGPLAAGTLLPYTLYALEPNLAGALLLLLASGACAAHQITAGSAFVRLAPDHRRGQAFGLARSGQIAVQGLGVVAGGLMAQSGVAVAHTIAFTGLIGTAYAIATAVAWIRTDPRRVAETLEGEHPG